MQENLVVRRELRIIGIFSGFAGFFNAIATLGYGLVIGQMVDAAASSTYERMAMWAGITVALYVIQELMGVAYNFTIGQALPNYENKTRGLLLVNWLKVVPKRKMTAGKMNNAVFNDLSMIVQSAESSFNSAGYGIASLLGGLSIMFWLHWIVGLVAIGTALIDILTSLIAGSFAGKIEGRISQSTQGFYGKARQTDDNKIQYLSMRLLGRFKKAVETVYKVYAKEQLDLRVKRDFAYNLSTMVAICVSFAPIVAGGLLFGQQSIGYGAIAILVILSREVSAAGLYINNAVSGYMQARNLKKKYLAKQTAPILNIGYEDFTPHFSAEKKANYKLDVEIRQGKKYLFKGANGIGKSTALEIFMRPIEYDGKLVVNQQGIKEQQQLDQYYALTPVADNALFESIGQIRNCSQKQPSPLFMQIAELTAPILEKKGQTKDASQGERQILSLLHTLANEPNVLVIDETLSSVDQKTRKHIYSSLLSQKELAVVVVDHTMDAETEGCFDEVINLQ